MIVYTLAKPVSELKPGDLIVSGGRVLTLLAHSGYIAGYHTWNYANHGAEATAYGHANLRDGSTVAVVCVDIRDGSIIGHDDTPVEVTS